MNAARRTMLSVFTAAGLSGALLAPTGAAQQGGPVTGDPVAGLAGTVTAPGADQRALRERQSQLLVASVTAAQPAASVPAAAPLRASRSRSVAAGGPDTGPKQYARTLLAQLGQGDRFGCLSELWDRESGWSVSSTNRTSGAYGIPQALPASKMSSAGTDWRTNPATQVRWGVGYIADRYGDPCRALAHATGYGWY